jgi:CIC family chloride channel protein
MGRPPDRTNLGRLIVAAAVVGAVGASAAIAVRLLLHHGLAALYGSGDVVSGLAAQPAWLRVVAPAVGGAVAGLLVSVLIRRGAPGVADVMEAVALGRGRPRFGAAAAQAAGSIAAALGGGSIGREGPLIQLGAGAGHAIAMRAVSSPREHRALVAAGTAAGFAAAYNTPLAAVLFVLEVIVGVATLEVIVPVAVATAVGTALTRAVVGGGPIYGERAFALASAGEFVAFAALGVIAALAGVGFLKLVGAGERLFARTTRLPRAGRAALGGLIVGLIAWQLPQVAGNGYEPLRSILDGQVPFLALLLLAAAKAVATTASVSSGSPGGVFTPTMLIGAALGAALGAVVAHVAPAGVDVAPGGYALVGMAAAVAATTHAPLMATVLGFELSGDYAIVLPLLLATAVATLLARRLERDSIYTAELRRRGIAWEGSVAERLARSVRARDLMEPATAVVSADEPLEVALSRLATDRGRLLYVVGGGPLRVISLTRAKSLWAACMRGEGLPAGATAGSVAAPVAVVAPGDSLVEVGEKLWDVDWGELPVVDPAHPEQPLGTISRRAVLGALDRELLQRDVLTTRVAASDGADPSVDYMELPDGHGAAVIAVPGWLCGTVPDLARLRAEMGVILVAVRRDTGGDALPRWLDPDAGVRLESGDRLLVIATQAELAALRSPR